MAVTLVTAFATVTIPCRPCRHSNVGRLVVWPICGLFAIAIGVVAAEGEHGISSLLKRILDDRLAGGVLRVDQHVGVRLDSPYIRQLLEQRLNFRITAHRLISKADLWPPRAHQEETAMGVNDHAPDIEGEKATELRPAAQYVRMSTEHQQYSTENQSDVIHEYARKRGFRIVATYEDSRLIRLTTNQDVLMDDEKRLVGQLGGIGGLLGATTERAFSRLEMAAGGERSAMGRLF